MTREGRIFVCFCFQEQCQVGTETYRYDGHAVVLGLSQQLAIELWCREQFAVVFDAAFVERPTLLIGLFANHLCVVGASHNALR